MPLPIYLALDELGFEEALELARAVKNRVAGFKIHNLYDQYGRIVVEQLHKAGVESVFVDLKIHDIPNTARLRALALKEAGADIITVHASGGIEMMFEAAKAGVQTLGITIPTSINEEECNLIYGGPTKAKVLLLARWAKLAGLPGLVCSPKEVGLLSKQCELRGMQFFVPGTRSADKGKDDQARVDTPANAIKAGATYLVVGRQVTQAKDPTSALDQLEQEINQTWKEQAQKEAP
ncbi:orotidine-5'-phosphate decarboxylase [Candidatus Parcubacteria bacterium]|nr:MAG: orotidine-5'-phosphate decarboxylase [Candidatus Parcubacteria bacterium]